MSTATKTRRRVKPVRTIRLTLKPFDGNPGVVRITVGKETADYLLTEIPADFGRGFKVEKMGDVPTGPPTTSTSTATTGRASARGSPAGSTAARGRAGGAGQGRQGVTTGPRQGGRPPPATQRERWSPCCYAMRRWSATCPAS